MKSVTPGRLSVAIVLVPNFTLLAFSAFVDTLRLAADEGDGSRPIRCSWTVVSHDMRPIRSSCGVSVLPTCELDDPSQYDYVAVVGGLLGKPLPADPLVDYLRRAAMTAVPLVGLCTGSFVLARAGLMQSRRCCVSWFHHADFVAEFPYVAADSEVLYVVDRDRLTCAGGTSVVHLASLMVERHCGREPASKALRIMIEDAPLPGIAPQPQPLHTAKTSDPRIRRAMSVLERNLDTPVSIPFVARHAGVSPRQLERIFKEQLGASPSVFALTLRLTHAKRLVTATRDSIHDVALQCGFSSSAHFARRFRAAFGMSPSAWRNQCAAAAAQARLSETF